MKIYTITNPVEGMHEPTYDEVLLSGYTAGYESGYTDGKEECGLDYSRKHFTIEALEDGNLTVRCACDYSINYGDWVSMTGVTAIPLNDGDKVRFRANLENAVGMFSLNTIRSMVYGNIESLAYGDDFIGEDTCISCSSMFNGYSGLTSAENLILPATELISFCYRSMFSGCTSLTTYPELPATEVKRLCYGNMFADCTSLITAPALPATVLAEMCYEAMFYNCSSLATPPELPATTLADYCYRSMFYGCTSLTQAPMLPAPTSVKSCYNGMFRDSSVNYVKCLATNVVPGGYNQNFAAWLKNVSPTGTFVKAAGVEWPTGQDGIPAGWTVVEAE